MQPVLKYRGGKSKEIPRFARHIPDDFDRYIEPFFGGGAVFFHIEPARALLNDANTRLMRFYRDLRDAYPRMRGELDALQRQYDENRAAYRLSKRQTPDVRVPDANEALYYALRERFNHPDGTYLEGTLYYFINKTAYSGMIRYNADGAFNVPFGRYPRMNAGRVTEAHSRLLRRAELHNGDYESIFSMARANDFAFLDPPYDCPFNDYGNTRGANGFDEAQQRRLAENFRKLPCRALMIVGKTPLTEALYRDFVVDAYHKSYAVNIRNRFHSERTHLVVRNY